MVELNTLSLLMCVIKNGGEILLMSTQKVTQEELKTLKDVTYAKALLDIFSDKLTLEDIHKRLAQHASLVVLQSDVSNQEDALAKLLSTISLSDLHTWSLQKVAAMIDKGRPTLQVDRGEICEQYEKFYGKPTYVEESITRGA